MARFIQNGEEVTTVQFPITEIGTSSTISIMLENEFENNVELIFYSEDEDVTIDNITTHLTARERKTAVLTFSPRAERLETPTPALNTEWGFREIIGP